jgi:hypothetical protein
MSRPAKAMRTAADAPPTLDLDEFTAAQRMREHHDPAAGRHTTP